jgi:cardiolipin synthase
MRLSRSLFSSPSPPSSRIFTIPNVLTVSRIACAPLLGHAIVSGRTSTAVCLLGYAAVSDVVDGWIARKFNQASDLGSYLDPLADKLLVTVGCISLGSAGLLPVSVVALVVKLHQKYSLVLVL